MFPSCVSPLNNISFKATAKTSEPLPSQTSFPLSPLPLPAILSPPPTAPHRQATQHNQDICVYKSFLHGPGCGAGVREGNRHGSAASTATSSEEPSSVSSPPSPFLQLKCAHLEEAKKRLTILLFSMLALNRKESNSGTFRKKVKTLRADIKVISYQNFLAGQRCLCKEEMRKHIFFYFLFCTEQAQLRHRTEKSWVLDDHSPGNRNAGIFTGDHAVLLLRIDHGGINCQRGAGVDYGAGSIDQKVYLIERILHFYLHYLKEQFKPFRLIYT